MSTRDAAADLHRLIDGYKTTQAVHVAAVLGVADHVAAGLCTADEMADAAGAHAGALYRLLRALAAIGILSEDHQRRFSLTPLGECLRSDDEHTLRPFATMTGQDYYWRTWGHLLRGVRTGESSFRAVHGMDSWAYRDRHPELGAVFNDAMTANARRVDPSIVEAIDFRGYARIADIGGGQGSLLASVLLGCPGVRGVLFDRPSVVAAAGRVLAVAGVDDRCEVVGGDMFESVPRDCAAYLMKFVIHDWDDSRAAEILRVCRRDMGSDARLFVVERLVGPPNEHLAAKLSDLNMLVGPGGRERTREEFVDLFSSADLRLSDVVGTRSGLSVIVGVPA